MCRVPDCNKIGVVGRGLCGMHYARLMRHGSTRKPKRKRSPIRAFIRQALSSDTDDCIIYPFMSPNQRYAHFKYRGVNVLVHRFVCERTNGPAPMPGMQAAHSCGNTACINKRHVRWKTSSYNNLQDKVAHGTIMRGERHHKHKLTRDDVWAIRRMHRRGWKGVDIAAAFDISCKQVSSIWKLQAWSWLGDPPPRRNPF